MSIKQYFWGIILIFGGLQSINAQSYRYDDNPWIVGFGANVIYDAGKGFSGLTNVKNNYNYEIPFRLSIEKRFANHYGFEVSGNLNRLLKGKVVDRSVLTENITFLAIDGMFKYYITNLFLDPKRSYFEGFVTVGGSDNLYNGADVFTANLGFGLNGFLTERIRVSGQVLTKYSIKIKSKESNFLQFNLSLILCL